MLVRIFVNSSPQYIVWMKRRKGKKEASVMFSKGQTVGIPCEIKGGAFSNEYLVSIATEEGLISGFADQRDVRPDPKNRERGVIRAIVEETSADRIKVRIFGSFFTTAAGMMQFSSHWANEHLQHA
jgi:hypothetical protein